MAQGKQYGLILPGKSKPEAQSKPKNIFGNNSSDEEESNVDWVKQSIKKKNYGSMQQKQSMQVLKKAMEDDPSVFEYDAVYDEMERNKNETIERKKADKKPKYIEGLLKTAKQRELENELRKERLAQRERENEGDEFADKEAFVTSAYKKKMEDLRKMQANQANDDAVDDLTEVTKQKDLSGFYRYMYKEKMKDEPDAKIEKRDRSKSKEKESTKQDRNRSKSKEKETTKQDRNRSKSKEKETTKQDRNRSESKEKETTKQDRNRSKSKEKETTKQDRNRSKERETSRQDRSRSKERESNRHSSRQSRNLKPSESDKGKDHRSRHEHRDSRSYGRDRYYHSRNDKEDKPKSKDSDNIPDKNQNPKSSSSKDSKLKIIQKENWYEFDVEIQRDVDKNFYEKRNVGKAFDEALQRYLLRKGPAQELDLNSKYI